MYHRSGGSNDQQPGLAKVNWSSALLAFLPWILLHHWVGGMLFFTNTHAQLCSALRLQCLVTPLSSVFLLPCMEIDGLGRLLSLPPP